MDLKTTQFGTRIASVDNHDPTALMRALLSIGTPQRNPDPDGRHYAVVPKGCVITDLPTACLPARPIGCAKLLDAASFIRYVTDHAVPRSRIYGTVTPPRLVAVFDDFATATDGDEPTDRDAVLDLERQADWREFRAEFVPQPSSEWTKWTALDRSRMTQLAFAEHLQDNLIDVTDPDGATLLEMALHFEAMQAGHVVSAQRLQDGSATLVIKTENNSAGTVRLPERITLQIPIFDGEPRICVLARIRYRCTDGRLVIWYEIEQRDRLVEASLRGIWARVGTETNIPVLYGAPE